MSTSFRNLCGGLGIEVPIVRLRLAPFGDDFSGRAVPISFLERVRGPDMN